MTSTVEPIDQIRELLKIDENTSKIVPVPGSEAGPNRETWEKIMKIVEEADPPNSSLTSEYMWNCIWKELDKRGRYSRNVVPKGHDPTVIYNSIKVVNLFAVFEDTHPVDALFMGYFMRNFGQLDQAQNAYQFAADQGNVDALIGLGTIAEAQGNSSSAEEYYKDALSKGEIRACANLGNIYKRRKNFTKALEMYITGVSHNNTDCMYMAALMYDDPSIEEFYNPEMAEKLFDQAIELGCYFSMYKKGVNLVKKEDTWEEGLVLWERSADLGFTFAMERLIWYYGLTQDSENCKKWVDRLVDVGDSIAKEFLTTVLEANKKNDIEIDADVQATVDSFPDIHLGYTIISNPKGSDDSKDTEEPSSESPKSSDK